MLDYQQLDAEIAQCKAEQDLIKQRLDALKQRRGDVMKHAQDAALPAIVAQLRALGITQSQLATYLGNAASDKPIVHKYWNPETKETHSGKGTLPGWLVGKTGKGRSGDPRYLNPAWIAKEDAKEAAKSAAKGSKKSKTKSSGASVADPAQASSVAATASNDTPTMTDSGERNVAEVETSKAVASRAATDATDTSSNTLFSSARYHSLHNA
ncbi:H-NS family nucleoid-associated regulatory protein [Burkholderia pseudomallei]|uniref:H-NS family nucleoid-associated regulatory protein n=1 Tax=Burkholderia pseudomallei TaxID=28450 RepID=UPI0009779961|nr:H-NS family nucleoid-associated regulatory protein [Burkholderia pseudomallei]